MPNTTPEQKAKNKIMNDKAKAKREAKKAQTTIATAVRGKIARTAVETKKKAKATIIGAVKAKIERDKDTIPKLRKAKIADDEASAKPTSIAGKPTSIAGKGMVRLTDLPKNIQRQIIRLTNMNSGSKNDFDENGVSVLQNTIKTDAIFKSKLFILNSKAKRDRITKGNTELTYNWTDDAHLPPTGGYRTVFDKQVKKYTSGKGVAQGYLSDSKGRFFMLIFNYGRDNTQTLFAHEGGETSYSSSPELGDGEDFYVPWRQAQSRSPQVLNEDRKIATTGLMKKKKEKFAKMAKMGAK